MAIKYSQSWVCSTHPSIGKCNCHYSSSLHNPRERIPHEPQELQEFYLLQNTQKDNSPQNSNFLVGLILRVTEGNSMNGRRKRKIRLKLWNLFLFQLVVAKNDQPLLSSLAAETFFATSQILENLLNRNVLLHSTEKETQTPERKKKKNSTTHQWNQKRHSV